MTRRTSNSEHRDRAPNRSASSAAEPCARHRWQIFRACSRRSRRGTAAPRSAQGSVGRPPGRCGRRPLARSPRTALGSRQPLGSIEITHPFHPLRGQKFVVLKLRTVSGVATLSVRHPDLGSFAIREDWTDWSVSASPSSQSLMIDAFGLAALAEIVEAIGRASKRT